MSRLKSLSPLAVALVISLVANALLLGLVLGNSLGKPARDGDDGRRGGPRGGGEEFMLARGLESVVPEETQDEMRETFRETFRKSRDLWQAKHEARDALTKALAARPFDQAAVDAAFADMRAADDALKARFQSALSDQFESLTQDQRDALVARLEEIEARRERWRERRRQDRKPEKDKAGSPDGGRPR
ncbi:periplasmic heavy metal sensor [Henriciella aquimarina]|uniref:periplasmic heavy metal sensor n=1 Tax=Henriciella aquimarina TaxID=545261 RepID=UPI000A029734|nr:periplasmic heavy metal sensor [Henriciella aquimarina]